MSLHESLPLGKPDRFYWTTQQQCEQILLDISALFIWHAGEERGLIGSSDFVQHPAKPLVYKINADRMQLDETDKGNFFMRSDHFNYARNRIPVVFFSAEQIALCPFRRDR